MVTVSGAGRALLNCYRSDELMDLRGFSRTLGDGERDGRHQAA